jgi:NIMA (never in mitosis gene a)-related kinase
MAIAHRDVGAILQKHGFKEVKKVGEGSFGKAILVQTSDGSKLICKMVDISKASARETQDALKEGKLLATLKHPYVVRYRENFTDKGWFCILMDYCEGGDLTKQIDMAKKGRQTLQEEQILRWFTQAVLGLKYIHDKHILHRDLKPSNFFLTGGTLQMGDFGIAKVLSNTLACAKTQIGTPYYLSPEVCQERPYSWASDIWALGCILYEMCALRVPFDAPSISGLVQKIIRGQIPTIPGRFSAFTRTLCSEMLNRNPNSRPGPEDILARPRIQSIVKELLGDALADRGDDERLVGLHAAIMHVCPEAAAPRARSPNGKAAANGPYADSAGTYKKGDLVDYNSTAHKDWLHAIVFNVDGEGRIVIDLKPNTWLTKEEQAAKIRPRRSAKENVRDAVRAAPSPMRNQSPSRKPAGSPMIQRSPSANAFDPQSARGGRAGTPMGVPQRSPSADALKRVPASPQRPARAASADQRAPAASPPPASPVTRRDDGRYKKGDLVEYFSATHKDWLPAVVVNVDMEGKIVIDLKPNTWLRKDEQAEKIRRRGKQDAVPPRAGHGGASPLRQRSPSAPGRERDPGCPGSRAPSREASPARPSQRSPSREASPAPRGGTPWRNRAETPSRAASPHGGAPSAAGGTPRQRPPGIPRVSDSPMRRRSAVGAAGMVIAGA